MRRKSVQQTGWRTALDAESIVPGMLIIKYFLRPFEQPSNEQAESVQEDDVAARHCDQIPVASKFGGAAAVIQRATRSWTLLPDLEKLDPIHATELPACQHWSIKVTLLKFVPLPGFLLQLQLELVCKTSRHSAGLELVFLHASLQKKRCWSHDYVRTQNLVRRDAGHRLSSAGSPRQRACFCSLLRGITVDLYAGLGDTAALLADGLHRRPSSASDRRLVTFELNLDRPEHVGTHAAQQTHGQSAQRTGC